MSVSKYQTQSGIRYKAKFNSNHQTYKQHGFMNRRDAKDWEIAERARINVGGMRSDKTITVAEYLEWWHGSFVWRASEQQFIRNAKRRKFGRANHIRNRQHIDRISAAIGNIKICDLMPKTVYAMEERLTKSTANPKGLAPSTIRKLQFMLKGALEDGVIEQRLQANPIAGMTAVPASALEGKDQLKVFQDHEVDLLLATADKLYAEDKRWHLWAVMAVWSGMRKGEMAGLQWGDIDGNRLYVQRSVDWSMGETKPVLKSPKSKAGTRDIPLASTVVEALKTYRAWQGEIYLKAGRSMTNETLVFFNDRTFGLVHKSVPQDRWNKLLKAAGLPHRSMHITRHTFASRAIRGGIRRELLSAVMGHSEEQVTTKVYGHLMDDSFGDTLKVLHSVENGLGRQ